jgi:hypothetical protein
MPEQDAVSIVVFVLQNRPKCSTWAKLCGTSCWIFTSGGVFFPRSFVYTARMFDHGSNARSSIVVQLQAIIIINA